ncbi:P-loop NTPase fold protein [Streptomyces sp. NBC_00358]|jgi:Predicted P-loop ATPase|uniref:P-loop NTPase fold protein n=1 Tax=Streptomyces sp. NBC_00358 TaxID=2975725 RepID=UPI002E265B01
MEFSLLNDEPVAGPRDDLLGTGRAARELAKLLHDSRAATPLTLAVDAGWGMGKSSLMRLVDAELRTRDGVHTVWYNAWTSTGADALEGLIKSVLMRFDRRVLRRALRRVSEQPALIRFVRAVLTLGAAPFGVAALVDRLWRDLSLDARSRNAMRDALRQLAAEWTQSTSFDTRRLLVVFVDDLDRCSEETVLAVCEAVKVYLDVPGLAFVIGCDRSALGPSGLLRDLSPAGSAFMEKIFQTSYRVPVPAVADVRAYVDRCAERSGIQDLLGDHLAELIALRSARNPRRIKRLINGFGLECALNPVWESFSAEAVIRVLLLQQLYPDFYRVLLARDGADVHAAREFVRYRATRRVLSQPFAQPADEDWPGAVHCLLAYGLVAPEPDRPGDRGVLLARLEEHLPTGFPELALDQNFVRLIDELMELAEVDDLVGQLQQGAPRLAVDPADGAPEPGSSARPGGAGPAYSGPSYAGMPYAGMQVLWTDDHPERNTRFVELLEAQGARVQVATDRDRAEQVLDATRIDLLVSDVQRGLDREAGLDDLGRWRESGRYAGPAVFFTSRTTPNREARAAALGARVATSGALLFRYAEEANEPAAR